MEVIRKHFLVVWRESKDFGLQFNPDGEPINSELEIQTNPEGVTTFASW
jgi:hypothetical protein